MKLQPDRIEGVNAILSYASGTVRIAQASGTGAEANLDVTESVVVPWQGKVLPWRCAAFEQLAAEHFELLASLSPEIVLFGSGSRLRFPSPSLVRALIDRRIGLETMDTAAACRTYNVLVGERRSVVAALLL